MVENSLAIADKSELNNTQQGQTVHRTAIARERQRKDQFAKIPLDQVWNIAPLAASSGVGNTPIPPPPPIPHYESCN